MYVLHATLRIARPGQIVGWKQNLEALEAIFLMRIRAVTGTMFGFLSIDLMHYAF
jgi:hypothetical protein